MSNFRSTLYSYHSYLEDGLFVNLSVPAGIDSAVLIDVILAKCGEMCPVWTDPEFMQEMIGVWSSKWSKTFAKWLAAYNADYNPIHNYDRHEEIEDENSASNSGEDSSTVTNTRSAYNSTAYEPHDKSTVEGETSSESSGSYTRDAHMYGNIGVVTTQQMLTAEYDIAQWNIYENIADIFMMDFCIMIY